MTVEVSENQKSVRLRSGLYEVRIDHPVEGIRVTPAIRIIGRHPAIALAIKDQLAAIDKRLGDRRQFEGNTGKELKAALTQADRAAEQAAQGMGGGFF